MKHNSGEMKLNALIYNFTIEYKDIKYVKLAVSKWLDPGHDLR